MKVFDIEYPRLAHWSHTDLAYIQQDPKLLPFLSYSPGQSQFGDVISARKKYETDRALLLRTLKKQYEDLGYDLPVAEDILLDESTFTVASAHQPVLFTGPLFHIYKIASTIHLAKKIQEETGNHILPVFILGSEDHDWEEINHLFLFGRKYTWERKPGGPAGRMNLDGLEEMVKQITELFANTPFGSSINTLLTSAISKAKTYGQFHQALLIGLFQEHGLLVLNMDEPELKKAFIPVMEREITEQFSVQYVTSAQQKLEQAGFKAQAFCRPVNLFYISDGLRERIEPTENGMRLVDRKINFSKQEIVEELRQHPDRFSPNVILRPLYEEYILPNLAYVGGGGELAYWMERKSQFDAAGIHFPMLVRRNSVLLIDGSTATQLEKADLSWADLLDDYDVIVKKFLQRQNGKDFSFEEEQKLIHNAYQALADKAERIDPTLAKAILAEESKQVKQFEQLAGRLIRAEKQQQDTNLKRIQKLKEKLFPEGKLQERNENFLSFYAHSGPELLQKLIEICDPMDTRFKILMV